MKFAINVGLHVSGGDNSASAVFARAVIAHLAIGGFIGSRGSYNDRQVYRGGQEPTLIVKGYLSKVSMPELENLLFELAISMQQACIAVAELDADDKPVNGQLIGPNAAAWGAFNPDYFVLAN